MRRVEYMAYFAPCFLQVFQELRASIRGVSKFVTLSPDLRHPVTGFAAADVRASVFGVDSPISFWDRWPLDRFAHLFWGRSANRLLGRLACQP